MRPLQVSSGASLKPLHQLLLVAAGGLLLDFLTKQWALATLSDGVRRPILGDLLGLRLIFNPGAAFSFGSGSTWLFSIVAIVVIVVILRSARSLASRAWALTLGLLLAGALGNLADRLFRAPGFGRGHVVDFIDYRVFIGNVADIYIVLAAIIMVYLTLRGVEPSGSRAERTGADDA